MDKKVLDDYSDVITVEELMDILHIGRNTAYGLVKDGVVKSVKIGRTYRIPKKCIKEFLDQIG